MIYTQGYASRCWSSRGYLPHFHGNAFQFITFRLVDSLPKNFYENQPVRPQLSIKEQKLQLLRETEKALDRGFGSCALGIPQCGKIVFEALKYHDGDRYRLEAAAVMPNHAHALILNNAGHTLSTILQSWKSFTSKEILKLVPNAFPNRRVWQREYFDRFMRDRPQLEATIRYISLNPQRARLRNWPWLYVRE